jgi:predicted MFS family arabinose efflux permease
LAGIGNGVFHPVDYTLLNRKVSASRLGHAYSVHGITGSLGWALSPALVVSLTLAYSWRVALMAAALVAFAVLAVLVFNRSKLTLLPAPPAKTQAPGQKEGSLEFLKIPAVWMCFAFFFVYAIGLSIVQAFAPEAARRLHDVPLSLVALCLTVFMVGSACGMVSGGFLASHPERCERIVGLGFGFAALMSLTLAFASFSFPIVVPVLFALMGFSSGLAAPSRDLLVKRSTPDNATGRVYGVVYSGLDIGQALSPLIFGVMMDHGNFRGVLLGLALVQGVLIVSAFSVRRVRRTALMLA